MAELKPPYEDWQPGEVPIRHHERFTEPTGTRIEKWRWNQKQRCWELMAVFAGTPNLQPSKAGESMSDKELAYWQAIGTDEDEVNK